MSHDDFGRRVGLRKVSTSPSALCEQEHADTLSAQPLRVRSRGSHRQAPGRRDRRRHLVHRRYAICIERQVLIGNAYFKRGDISAALTAYQQATDIAPTDSTYWRLLAVFCADNNVHVEDIGLPAAQKAVELAPDDPYALDALGWTFLASGRYANAAQILLDATKRFPDHLAAHIHLAMTYLAQDDRTAAFNELIYVRDADGNGADGLFANQLLEKYFP